MGIEKDIKILEMKLENLKEILRTKGNVDLDSLNLCPVCWGTGSILYDNPSEVEYYCNSWSCDNQWKKIKKAQEEVDKWPDDFIIKNNLKVIE